MRTAANWRHNDDQSTAGLTPFDVQYTFKANRLLFITYAWLNAILLLFRVD